MAEKRQPKARLTFIRVFWAVFASFMILKASIDFFEGEVLIPVLQLCVAALFAWLAISPPAFIRKLFVQ